MIERIFLWNLERSERETGYSTAYLRHMVSTSLGAFIRFAFFTPMASYRRKLGLIPWHVARIRATKSEDCGPCVQLVVDMAIKDGVSKKIVEATLTNRPQLLPEEALIAYIFTDTVVNADPDDDVLRAEIVDRYGERGLVELAMTIAACRVFPTLKRALGYAQSCQIVAVRVA